MSGEKVSTSELVKKAAVRSGESQRTVSAVLESLVNEVTEQLMNGNKVAVTGLGMFSAKDRPAREGRNPATGESMQIEAKTVPAFKPSKTLRDNLA